MLGLFLLGLDRTLGGVGVTSDPPLTFEDFLILVHGDLLAVDCLTFVSGILKRIAELRWLSDRAKRQVQIVLVIKVFLFVLTVTLIISGGLGQWHWFCSVESMKVFV